MTGFLHGDGCGCMEVVGYKAIWGINVELECSLITSEPWPLSTGRVECLCIAMKIRPSWKVEAALQFIECPSLRWRIYKRCSSRIARALKRSTREQGAGGGLDETD